MKKIKGYKRDFAQAVREAILEEQDIEKAEDTGKEESSDSSDILSESSSDLDDVSPSAEDIKAGDLKKKVDAQVDEALGVQKHPDMMPEISEDLSEELSSDSKIQASGNVEAVELTAETVTEEKKESEPKPEVVKKEKKGKSKKMSEMEHEIKREEELTGLSENTTYITKTTIITGDVEIDGDVEILGRVEGNVKCSGKLVVGGRVDGDIITGELYADNAHIQGTVTCDGLVRIGAGSVLVGNVSATSAMISGAVKGDIDIKGDVEIGSTAVIVGNIKSKSVQISSGAVVEGMCQQVYASVDVSQYFEDGIQNLDEASVE
ncbi:MAG: polymer-forming cytoskeletal protein [Eubacterium sp.]|nr:polymer-forming cytoskeletal protein [Eubacterium sp.]